MNRPVPSGRPSAVPRRSAARPGASTRSATLALSVIVTLGIIGSLVYVATRSPATTGATGADTIATEDIMDILGGESRAGEGMVIQRVDEDDPTRLVAEFSVDRLDPDGPSHRSAEAPRAWLFAEDGSSWHIEADRGRFYIPAGKDTPESGFLRGNVRARRYDPQPGDARPEPGVTPASVTATTDEPLHFDLDSLMFETEGRLHVESEEIDFVGRGVFAVLNEKREKITVLKVDRGERLTYTPRSRPTPAPGVPSTSRDAAPVPRPHASTRPASPAIRPVAFQAAIPKVDLYKTEFEDNVVATQGSRVVRSDTLTVWTRLIDNKIPKQTPAASARGPLHTLLTGLAMALTPPPPVDTETSAPTTVSTQQPAGIADSVVLTWDGPMEIHPLKDDPNELSMGDHVALRFDIVEDSVEFEDTAGGARGRAQAVSYFAGRERIELLGPAGTVELESDGTGRISGANSMYVELAAGVVTVPTAGRLTGVDHRETRGEEDPQEIVWQSAATFEFVVVDGRMTDRVERARFEGGVTGKNSDATLEGERIDALFDSRPDENPRLVQLDAEQALGEDGRGGAIAGDTLQVHFAPGAGDGDLDPRRVIISGSALARREDAESIRADRIDAALARDERGDIIVTIAEADGHVVFGDGRGAEGRGEHLWADALAERAVITGESGRVAGGSAEITGAHIELDNTARSVRVQGPGTFAQAADEKTIEASWTEAMAFDDRAGHLECIGNTRAHSVGPDGTRDHVEAHRLEITLDPYTDDDEETGDRLRHALAFGSADTPAAVETRRLAVDSPPEAPRVDEIFRLEGGQIRFAARDDRLHVPGPGRLFVFDRRPETGGGGGDAMLGPGGRRGSTQFTWAGSLGFDRRAGDAVFIDSVRVVHKPIDQPVVTELLADELAARFSTETSTPSAGQNGFDGELLWAEARRNALLHVERRREIEADRLLYHAQRGLIEAAADPGSRVQITDLLRGTSSRPRAVSWDMTNDRIEFIEPGSVVAPE